MTRHYGFRTSDNSYSGNIPIVEMISGEIVRLGLGEKFRLLDMCCGYGGLLRGLRSKFKDAILVGVDMRSYDEWGEYASFIEEDMDEYMKKEGEEYFFDIVVMLDTYRARGWDYPITSWLRTHCKYFITDILRGDKVNIPFRKRDIGEFKADPLGGFFDLVLCYMGRVL